MRKFILVLLGVIYILSSNMFSTAQSQAAHIIVEGVWETNFGKMVLVQRGNIVEGHYTHDKGKIKGRLEGNIFVGKWMERPSYKPPRDAGDVRLVFTKDGKSFSGHWRYGFGGNSWNGNWSGKKVNSNDHHRKGPMSFR